MLCNLVSRCRNAHAHALVTTTLSWHASAATLKLWHYKCKGGPMLTMTNKVDAKSRGLRQEMPSQEVDNNDTRMTNYKCKGGQEECLAMLAMVGGNVRHA